MRNKTFFSLSVEKGLRGNIGKKSLVESSGGDTYMNVMLFLVANNGSITDDRLHQVLNVHFPTSMFESLESYGIGDYIRVHFNRIDIVKGIEPQTGLEKYSFFVKANQIELLKKADKKRSQTSEATSIHC